MIELEDGAIRFTHPLLLLRAVPGGVARSPAAAHAQVFDWVDDPAGARAAPGARGGGTRRRSRLDARGDGAHGGRAWGSDRRRRARRARDRSDAGGSAGGSAQASPCCGSRSPRCRRRLRARERSRSSCWREAALGPGARGGAGAPVRDRGDPTHRSARSRRRLSRPSSQPALQASAARASRRAWAPHPRPRWAERHARQAVELADRLDDDGLRAGALSKLAFLRFGLGDPGAPADAERAYRLALDKRRRAAASRAARRSSAMCSCGPSRPSAHATSSKTQDREWRERDERIAEEAHWYLSLVELHAGRWDLAQRYAESARDIGEQYGQATPQHMYRARPRRPPPRRARPGSRVSRSAAESSPNRRRPVSAALPPSPGVVAAWSGDPTAARGVVRGGRAARRCSRTGASRTFATGETTTSRRCSSSAGSTRRWSSWTTGSARPSGSAVTWVLAHAARCRGLAAAARNEIDEAVWTLEEAVVKHEAAGDPFGQARALLALGVVQASQRGRSGRRGTRSSRLSPASRRSAPSAGPRKPASSLGVSAAARASKG